MPENSHTPSFPALINTRYLDALRHETTDEIPTWLMRQAGRYLPEYLATRSKAGSFMGLATNPDLACEVTLQPLDRYPQLDAAILFSDILTVPDAMGLGLNFIAGEGPKFEHPLRTERDVFQLQAPDLNQLRYVFNAVTTIRKALNGRVPLIGFSGSPWTLACYMVEGGGSSDFRTIKTMLYSRPDLIEHILKINTTAVSDYLIEQIKAGAQSLMVFDTWGGILPDGVYQSMSLTPMNIVIKTIKTLYPDIPITLFTKGGGVWLNDIIKSGADGIGLDWTMNLANTRKQVNQYNPKIALQGNIDPLILLGTPEQIQLHVKKTLQQYYDLTGNYQGYIFNLGHGINQFTPPDNVKVLLDTVKEMSKIKYEK